MGVRRIFSRGQRQAAPCLSKHSQEAIVDISRLGFLVVVWISVWCFCLSFSDSTQMDVHKTLYPSLSKPQRKRPILQKGSQKRASLAAIARYIAIIDVM